MVRPSAFAVLRLMTRSILVTCCTGRSAGLSPLRMRPVASASSVGCLLDGHSFVGSAAIGRVLVCGAAALARRDELAEHPEDVGRLPVDFSRQRMEIAQALVRA